LARKIATGLAVLAALLVLVPPSFASDLTGAIRGRIADRQGFGLPGAYIYVTSPSLLGIENYITSDTGRYGFVNLPPGTYKITVEMPGFKTVNVDGVVLAAGATATVNVRMETTEIEEEITSREPTPSVDRQSARLAVVLDRQLLTRIPLARDFTAVLGLVPGLVFENGTPGDPAAVYGAPVTANAFVQDGVDVTDPTTGASLSRINVDLIDQVVVETAAHPLDEVPVQGAVINVVNRSGGNTRDGSLRFTYTGAGLAQQLWSEAQLDEMGLPAAPADRRNLDLSLTTGGPVIRDFGWYFMNIRYRNRARNTLFPRTVNPLGTVDPTYQFSDKDLAFSLKLSARVSQKYQGSLEVLFSGINEPVYGADVAANRPLSATRNLDGGSVFLARGDLIYGLGPNTSADLSLGYVSRSQPLLLNAAGADLPQYYDMGTNLYFGSGPFNDRDTRKRFKADAVLTRLQDRAFGASHMILLGGDYQSDSTVSSAWKADDLIMTYLDGSPYLYGEAVSPVSGNTVGKGLVGFSIVPRDESAMIVRRELRQLGVFLQDTMNIAGRVALSFGLRFDHSSTRFPPMSKGQPGNEVALLLGSSLIEPEYGFNPFNLLGFGEWDGVIVWNSLYPRAGLSFDLLGTGRTVVKASYAVVPQNLRLGYQQALDPLSINLVHNFIWYDENGDGLVDAPDVDSYTLVPYNYNLYRSELYKSRVSPGLEPPKLAEWTAGFESEIARNFTLSVRWVQRTWQNVIGEVLYDPETGQSWYDARNSPEGWWVPFTTTVPGTGDYGPTPVTVYFRSTTAPEPFGRIQNVPELERKFRGLEFTFSKRMADNWQLFASLVWGRSTGTAGLTLPWAAGISASPLTPNSFVNVRDTSRTGLDRPFMINLMGTVRFKWDIFLSAYFQAMSGAPWARTVTIIPPESWVAENQTDSTPVTVYLESPDSHRHRYRKNLDLRLEKEFVKAGRTRFSVYLDVFNVLGDKYRILDLNDGGLWEPVAEGTGAGERILSSTYDAYTSALGVRVFAFSLSLGF